MKTQKIRQMTHLAILTAIILLMAFTPIGYLKIGPLSMTLIMIPVAVGAITDGVGAGAFLGLVFGLTSFAQGFGLDAFGSMLFSVNPLYYAILTVLPRVLMGLLAGLIYKALCSAGLRRPAPVIASLSAAVLNTLFFMSCLVLLFLRTPGVFDLSDYSLSNILVTVVAMVGIQGLCEAALTCAIGSAVSAALLKLSQKKQKA